MQIPSTSIALPDTIDPTWRIAIVHSSYYEAEIDAMVTAAAETLRSAGIPDENISVYPVPGSFEIPLVGAALARAGTADALIGLGIIVEGETHHARLIAEQAARGIMDVQTTDRIPFAFEILYVRDFADAKKRASGEGNKGAEAARSVLHSLATLGSIKS